MEGEKIEGEERRGKKEEGEGKGKEGYVVHYAEGKGRKRKDRRLFLRRCVLHVTYSPWKMVGGNNVYEQ